MRILIPFMCFNYVYHNNTLHDVLTIYFVNGFIDSSIIHISFSHSLTCLHRFLEMTFTYPTNDLVGHYTCDVTGVTDGGHVVRLQQSVDVQSVSLSLDDVVSQTDREADK